MSNSYGTKKVMKVMVWKKRKKRIDCCILELGQMVLQRSCLPLRRNHNQRMMLIGNNYSHFAAGGPPTRIGWGSENVLA